MRTSTAILTAYYVQKLLNYVQKLKIHTNLKFIFLHILELPYQRIELDYKND